MKKEEAKTNQGVKFLTPAGLASRWNLHPESVRRMIRRGQLPSVLIGRRRLIPLEKVEAVEAQGSI